MLTSLKLAIRNLLGAGLRTWLNVIVLSFSYVIIIWYNGLMDGWNKQARYDMINWEISHGQFWHQEYDPYDPFTIEDSHGSIPLDIKRNEIAAVLITQATIYPDGRMQSVLMKGIDPNQSILEMPTNDLNSEIDMLPAIIGTRMADNNKLTVGDFMTVRWRDANGTFDAAEAQIVGIFKTNVPTLDFGQIWVPLGRLQGMLQMEGEASIIISGNDEIGQKSYAGWDFKDQAFLLADIEEIVKSKKVGASIMYIILLLLALLAIFDTQVLSVFRRQKEIGTYVALGMTRGEVVALFTVEGAMHAILATGVAALYGIPLLAWQASIGYALTPGSDKYGLAIAERIFPEYSMYLIFSTILIILIAATIVSYLPSRKIARMRPTDALKGKIQ
jgi:ABC-type lipoprotein release transport system permease subunit